MSLAVLFDVGSNILFKSPKHFPLTFEQRNTVKVQMCCFEGYLITKIESVSPNSSYPPIVPIAHDLIVSPPVFYCLLYRKVIGNREQLKFCSSDNVNGKIKYLYSLDIDTHFFF